MNTRTEIIISLHGKNYAATVIETGSTITVSSVTLGSKSATIKSGATTTFLAETILEELVNESLGQGGWKKPDNLQ